MPEPDDQQAPGGEPQSGRNRLLHALMTPSRNQVVVAVLLALVAFAVVVQVRSTEADDTYAGYRDEDLIAVLDGLAGTSQRARAEIERLETTRDQLASDSADQRTALQQAQSEADTLAILAGLVPVPGPGVRITISEVTAPVNADTVVDMVQSLRVAGAEAIQVNGQVRLVAQSAYTDVTGGLEVDGEVLSAPYVFDVIGPPSALTNAMTILEGPRVDLQDEGAEVEITEQASIDIEAVADPLDPDFARPQDAQ